MLQPNFVYRGTYRDALAELFKARVYGLSLAGFAGPNPTGSMDVCLLWVCVASGRSLCVGPIAGLEEPNWLWVCPYVWSRNLSFEVA
jgi:hypothetical protein